jgi:putative transposase
MKKRRFSEEQMASILREAAAGVRPSARFAAGTASASRRFTSGARSSARFPKSDVRRLRELERENQRFKKLLAERDVEIDVMKELVQKK